MDSITFNEENNNNNNNNKIMQIKHRAPKKKATC